MVLTEFEKKRIEKIFTDYFEKKVPLQLSPIIFLTLGKRF